MINYDFIQTFDPKRKLQYINDDPSVMHCHHYSTLFTKLAIDFKHINATDKLRDSMEEAYYLVLKKAIIVKDIKNKEDKKDLIEKHFQLAGLGDLEITLQGYNGTARMTHSHMDEGWILKWGKSDIPVNYIGQGYLLAAFNILFDKEIGSYKVEEKQSIVSGYPYSFFEITLKGNNYGNR